MATAWYSDSTKLHGLLEALCNAGILETAEEVKSYLKTPMRYDDEYNAWAEAGYPITEDDEGWEDFTAAFVENEEEEEPEED